MPRPQEQRIEALHPDPKKRGTTVSREMYEAVRKAVLDAVPDEEPGLPFMDLAREVERRAPRRLFENASVSWYATTVKLDLEARGLIRRVPGVSPQRLVRGDADESAGRESQSSMNATKSPHSRRPRHPMPAFVREALIDNGLMGLYRERPPYQQNDYVGWIASAKREETRQKRLAQMLDELRQGDLYMKMEYRPARSKERRECRAGGHH